MNNKVVAITLFRRPRYTEALLAALDRCYGIEDYSVLISCDVASEHQEACDEVRRIVEAWTEQKRCASVDLYWHEPRLGIDVNKLFILPKAFEHSDYVVFLEDDTPPSPDALRFFEAMDERFWSDPNAISVSGYNRASVAANPYEIGKQGWFTPWGFAMWKDRYERVCGLDGQKYIEATGGHPNGWFDHNLRSWVQDHPGTYTVFPLLGRTNHTGEVDAEHTPSPQWLLENEYCPITAHDMNLPDPQDVEWIDTNPDGTFIGYEDWDYGKEAIEFMMRVESIQAINLGSWIYDALKPKTVIDLGGLCGLYLLPFKARGASVCCVDASSVGGHLLEDSEFVRVDLRYPYTPAHTYDFCICLETAEHLPPACSEVIVESACRCADTILWSAALPGQGGTNHHAERPAEWWLREFEKHGYRLHPLHEDMRAYLSRFEHEVGTGAVSPWIVHNSFLLQRVS